MQPIPLPSHVHYELLLQLLEQKTAYALNSSPETKREVQQLIITLRKALSQQKNIEASCDRENLPYEHHWSLNS